jgi:hypothetical protein
MCAGPHTSSPETGARGGPIWSAAPQRRSGAAEPAKPRGRPRSRAAGPAKPRGRPRSRAADREAARQSPRRHTGSPPAGRQGLPPCGGSPARPAAAGSARSSEACRLQTPGVVTEPPAGTLLDPALAGVTGRAGFLRRRAAPQAVFREVRRPSAALARQTAKLRGGPLRRPKGSPPSARQGLPPNGGSPARAAPQTPLGMTTLGPPPCARPSAPHVPAPPFTSLPPRPGGCGNPPRRSGTPG